MRADLRRSRVGWLAAMAAGAVFVLGPAPAFPQGKVQKVSKKLVDRAEETLKKIAEAEKQLKKVTDRYGKLLGGKNVKARRQELGNVRDEMKKLQDRARDVRERAKNMENEASRFFREWSKGLDGINDPELRTLSGQSMAESQDQYGRIIAAGRSSADQYDSYATMLGNQLKYLELDMSDAAIAKLKGTNQDLRGEARELNAHIDGFKSEIKQYIAALK